ncbi:hypothetical protein ACFQV2_01460 [Actinokineospora soli]|uniref:Uncharacterized protein n=1 Tax=Actinokineospora soli TaxID=1048753 RepID=A0ABW2TFJ6_9PSEU
MDAELVACALSGLEITVRVERDVAGLGRAAAAARAGPVGVPSSPRPNR